MSCGGTNSTGTMTDRNSDVTSDPQGTLYDATDVENNTTSRKPDLEKPATTTVNRVPNDDERATRQKMYTNLDMSDSQIQRYERESDEYMDNWRKENPNKNMSNSDRMKNRNNMMKNILDESQQTKYQQWSMENSNRN